MVHYRETKRKLGAGQIARHQRRRDGKKILTEGRQPAGGGARPKSRCGRAWFLCVKYPTNPAVCGILACPRLSVSNDKPLRISGHFLSDNSVQLFNCFRG